MNGDQHDSSHTIFVIGILGPVRWDGIVKNTFGTLFRGTLGDDFDAATRPKLLYGERSHYVIVARFVVALIHPAIEARFIVANYCALWAPDKEVPHK